jgi:pilus assembly protein FimV
MKTAVRRILLMSALMTPGALYALGLGEIHLNSALNQPFDADIELVSATQEDLGALRAALASSDAFSRYGLDRPAYLSDFTFRVAKGSGGQDVLKVTSPRPVTEPFVTLLVEANWPRGRLLREYTVLLDPPVFAPTPAASEPPVAAPRASSSAAPSSGPAPFAAESAAPASSGEGSTPRTAVASSPSIEGGSTYRVRPNDTLWQIASAAYPGSRSDVNRAMVAIFQNNPRAFDGNINVLHAGSVLKIPQAGEISSISASAASAEVARQYQMWKEGSTAGAAAGAEDAGRLRLVTPEQGTAAPSTTTSAPAAATPGAQSGDLNARVRQLETELAEARRLLEVRNAELATLQGQAAPGAAPAPGTAEPAATTPPVTATEVPVQPETAPAPVAEQPAAPAKVEPAKPVKPKPKPAEEEEGPSLFERLSQYWWVLLALLAAAGGALLFQRMRREKGAAAQDLEEALGRDMRAARPPVTTSPARESTILVEEKRPVETATPVTAAPRATEPARKPVTIVDTLSGDGAASIEAGDPLAEADFHMAYGLYDQAADLVQLAIKREPRRRDLKLKLLEIFFVWGNRDRFLELAREMNSSRADAPAGEWDKVLIMGKQIAPEDAMFAGSPRAGTADLDMELHGGTATFDMNLMAGASAQPDLDLTDGGTPATDETGLDFVIDEPLRGAGDAASMAPTVETPQLGSSYRADDTEEVPIESLGLEIDSTQALEELDKADEMFPPAGRAVVEDTVESTALMAHPAADETVEEDLLSSTNLMKLSENLAVGESDTSETAMLNLSDATGELPTIEAPRLSTEGGLTDVDYSIGEEAATMSEVGTKLDLARAYIDMGDPEGARSILDEVLQEGSAMQKQEAQRLMASLP